MSAAEYELRARLDALELATKYVEGDAEAKVAGAEKFLAFLSPETRAVVDLGPEPGEKLVGLLRKAIREQGGNVQRALGTDS